MSLATAGTVENYAAAVTAMTARDVVRTFIEFSINKWFRLLTTTNPYFLVVNELDALTTVH
jgi:hypothetical protein